MQDEITSPDEELHQVEDAKVQKGVYRWRCMVQADQVRHGVVMQQVQVGTDACSYPCQSTAHMT